LTPYFASAIKAFTDTVKIPQKQSLQNVGDEISLQPFVIGLVSMDLKTLSGTGQVGAVV